MAAVTSYENALSYTTMNNKHIFNDSTGNDMQFHHLHYLNNSCHLKGPPSSQLYRTVNKSNDMQFHHLNDLNKSCHLKGPPSSQLYRTVNKSNDMQFHHLNDLNVSYQLRGPPCSQGTLFVKNSYTSQDNGTNY